MEISKLNGEETLVDAVRRGQFGKSNEASTTARADSSWQEEAARFLLSSGFRPDDTIGQVKHIANPHGAGRTFGSVWRAMRNLVESEPECASGKAQDVVCRLKVSRAAQTLTT